MKTKIENEISIVENFISKEQAESIYKRLDKIKTKSPNDKIECALGFRDDFDLEKNLKNIDPEILEIVHSVKKLVENKFKENVEIKNCLYVNMLTGGHNPEHTDVGSISNPDQEKLNDEYNRKYSGLLYLNENYEGGHLNFTDHEFRVVPKSGMLIFFHGHKELKHEVTKVINGERKNIVMFFGIPLDKGLSIK
jgi:hypothetical protein